MSGAEVPLPVGFAIELDPSTRRLGADALFGGIPARVMHLSPAGRTAFAELLAGPVDTPAAAALARRLTDAGLAHPRPPGPAASPDVTVVVPVRDRAAELGRCLLALGNAYPVTVVDDASLDAEAIAKVAADHGARLVRRETNGGPGAARNTGLEEVTSEYVAVIDSDCAPSPGWIEHLAAHLGDPLVAVAAPRIAAPSSARSFAGQYAQARGILDLGATPARVQPLGRVAFVPSAAFVARTAALRALAPDGAVFDPALRTGEDVDLIWRLHKAGWLIRYDTAVTVTHHEPDEWRVLLRRRFRYGTSAGPLARRHPEAMPPLVLSPWPATATAGLLALTSPAGLATAVVGYAGSVARTRRALHAARVPAVRALPMATGAVAQTWLATGRFVTQLFTPILLAGSLRRRTRFGALSLLLAPAAVNWWRHRSAGNGATLDPLRFALGHVVDDALYGAGVWAGAVTGRTAVPVTPIGTRRARRAYLPVAPPSTSPATGSAPGVLVPTAPPSAG